MTDLDYLLSAALILLVVRQLRARVISVRSLIVPLAIVGYFCFDYLKTFPTAGNDVLLAISGAVLGLALGVGCAVATSVTQRFDGLPVAKAGWLAAALWILGVGGRLAFSLWVQHFGGTSTVDSFSAANDITSGAAWTDCLVLMALTEVAGRTLLLGWRGFRLAGSLPVTAPRTESAIMASSGN